MRKTALFFGIFLLIIWMGKENISAKEVYFTDVNKDHTHYEGVYFWAEKDVINGYITSYGSKSFKPGNTIDRVHTAVLLRRAMDLPIPQNASSVISHFKDVNENTPYRSDIAAVSKASIFKGSNGYFNGSAILTREQMATVLVNTFSLERTPTSVKINLTNVDNSHKESVQILADNGLTKELLNFRPKESVTRGQFATFLKRAHDVIWWNDLTEDEKNRLNAIKEKWNQLKPRYTGEIIKEKPNLNQPYELGTLHQGALNDALNITNFIRYISYLPDNIVLNDNFNIEAQAASLVNAVNHELTHYPTKPLNMDDTLFQLGAEGARTSNISAGRHSLTSSVIDGYMSDAGPSNIDRVGHRRWILSPLLKEVGFGFVPAEMPRPYSTFSAMKVIAPNMWSQESADYESINWPSESLFPAEFFKRNDPWSISLNQDLFSLSNDITVKLIDMNSKESWRFSHQGTQSDGYFNIDDDNYGYLENTIIFRPDNIEKYQTGSHYKVIVEGVIKKGVGLTSYEYEVKFFSLGE